MLHVITLILSASSGERLCKGTVSVRLSVCLSVPSIDSQLAAATCSWLAALQLGRGRQVSINSCRCRVSAVNQYIPPAPKRRAGSVNAVIRGGSTRTCCCCFTQTRSTDKKEISLKSTLRLRVVKLTFCIWIRTGKCCVSRLDPLDPIGAWSVASRQSLQITVPSQTH